MSTIEIWTEVLPPAYHWSPEAFVGGTPEYVVETAGCLAKRGYDVRVYYDGPASEHNGVYYLPRDQYQGENIVLACNGRPPKLGQRNLYWSSLYHERAADFLDFDVRICMSDYHRSVFGDDSRVIPLACWPEKYANAVKTPKQCLYSSSPDRGGAFLKEIWPEVAERTGATLITTYHNKLSEDEMTELYKSSQFWLHPCQGIELFCISGYKAQAAGCLPVVVPNMALAETVRYGVKTTIDKYTEALIYAIENPPSIPTLEYWDWDDVTDKLIKLFEV